jgi:GH43 family beta-xylosidase
MLKLVLKIASVIFILVAIGLLISNYVWRYSNITVLKQHEVSMPVLRNPSSVSNIGDPYILRASDGMYYMYATSSRFGFKVWSSADLINWNEEGLAFEAGAEGWGSFDFWAPEVIEYDGKFFMYYTARWRENGSLRIGVAISDHPLGPFIDPHGEPMFDFGYAAIDAHVFIDESGKYLYFSRDCSENIVAGNHESHIYGMKLNDDMITVSGEPTLLLRPDQIWEMKSGPDWFWNEGAKLIEHAGTYYLMYSANFFGSRDYSVGYATSSNPLGPFVKYENNPVLFSRSDEVSGPGHNSITVSPDGSELFIVYHTHTIPIIGGGNRQMSLDRMGFRKDGTLFVNGPTLSVQPPPSGLNGLRNLADEAEISVSSYSLSTYADVITDGDTGFSLQKEHSWSPAEFESMEWIEFEWNEKKSISAIFVYGLPKSNDSPSQFAVFVDGRRIEEEFSVPYMYGEAATVYFKPTEIGRIRLVFNKEQNSGSVPSIAEVVIIGED